MMRIIENVISDRGSRYAVSGGPAINAEAAADFLSSLKQTKKFARATHNSWALLLDPPEGSREALKGDDGEVGAGGAILRMLEREDLCNHIIVVTRWYGGVKLGGDRFRHVTAAVRAYLSALRDTPDRP